MHCSWLQPQTCKAASRALCPGLPAPAKPPFTTCQAYKNADRQTPEDRALSSLVETGIRGSISMAAAYALHLNLFSHTHLLDIDAALTGLQFAAPCIALEAALLLLSDALGSPANGRRATAADGGGGGGQRQAIVLRQAVSAAYAHNTRYSLGCVGATQPGLRLALEAAAQLSDDLLARGVLLGCSTAWLSSRAMEAGLCDGAAFAVAPCTSSAEVVAAAGICALIASRYAAHHTRGVERAQAEREAAAAEAAARQALLRYEPMAVQEAAAGAAAAAAADGEPSAWPAGAASGGDDSELVAALLHRWLGLRFVLGQAAMFGAFIASGDNLLAPFVAGMAMVFVTNACCERHLRRSVAA